MKRNSVLSIVSAIFIFLGFGMLHATPIVSTIGSILIGIGCLYLIYRLYISMNNSE